MKVSSVCPVCMSSSLSVLLQQFPIQRNRHGSPSPALSRRASRHKSTPGGKTYLNMAARPGCRAVLRGLPSAQPLESPPLSCSTKFSSPTPCKKSLLLFCLESRGDFSGKGRVWQPVREQPPPSVPRGGRSSVQS